METRRNMRRTRYDRGRTSRMRGGARSAMSVIAASAADALRDAAMAAPPASAGPAEAAKSYVLQTNDSFGDLKARLLDDNDIARKTEYIMHGNADEILPAYDKMVAKTQTRLAEYIHKLSAELAAEHNPKVRAKLEDSIFSVLVAAQATRDKLKAERLRLKAAVKDMRSNPKLQKQAASVLSTGVKTAIAVFGVAAISYAGYHYGSKLLKNIDVAPKSAEVAPKVADVAPKVAEVAPKVAEVAAKELDDSKAHIQTLMADPGSMVAGILLNPKRTATAISDVSSDTFKMMTSAASIKDAVNNTYNYLTDVSKEDIRKEMHKLCDEERAKQDNGYTKRPEQTKTTWEWMTTSGPKLGPSEFDTNKKWVDDTATSAKNFVNSALYPIADVERNTGSIAGVEKKKLKVEVQQKYSPTSIIKADNIRVKHYTPPASAYTPMVDHSNYTNRRPESRTAQIQREIIGQNALSAPTPSRILPPANPATISEISPARAPAQMLISKHAAPKPARTRAPARAPVHMPMSKTRPLHTSKQRPWEKIRM